MDYTLLVILHLLVLLSLTFAEYPSGCLGDDNHFTPDDPHTRKHRAFCNGFHHIPYFDRAKPWILIDLQDGDIDTIQSRAFEHLTIRDLVLRNNKIRQIEKGAFNGLIGLRTLTLDGNKLTVLENDMFRGLDDLAELSINNNKISFINPAAFSGLPRLARLSLEGNVLSRVPTTALLPLPDLMHLDLSRNLIQNIHDWAFDGLRITELNLGGNMDSLIISPRAFCGLGPKQLHSTGEAVKYKDRMLKALNLAGNGLRSLSPCGKTLMNVRNLLLADNKLQCTCDLIYLRDMGLDKKSSLQEVVCDGPPDVAGQHLTDLDAYRLGCDYSTCLVRHNCENPEEFCQHRPKGSPVRTLTSVAASVSSQLLSTVCLVICVFLL